MRIDIDYIWLYEEHHLQAANQGLEGCICRCNRLPSLQLLYLRRVDLRLTKHGCLPSSLKKIPKIFCGRQIIAHKIQKNGHQPHGMTSLSKPSGGKGHGTGKLIILRHQHFNLQDLENGTKIFVTRFRKMASKYSYNGPLKILGMCVHHKRPPFILLTVPII